MHPSVGPDEMLPRYYPKVSRESCAQARAQLSLSFCPGFLIFHKSAYVGQRTDRPALQSYKPSASLPFEQEESIVNDYEAIAS